AIREELRDMARRLATAGYYVVLPNLYYRAGVLELGGFATEADRARMFELMASINIPLVMSDTAALLTYIDSDPAARKGPMGAVGYCMSGQYAINAAAYYPDRVKAAASIYGVSLVTDDHDSPHLAAQKVQGEVYFACAEIDAYAPLEMVEALAQSVTANGVNGEVELYAGVHHGFAFPQRPAYDKTAAERHWERLLALFKRNL
ncbi:MAG: dienelactone hydrolase family protein, partial [Phenylobacterium sp.]|nr:dienelactone hydrolase family protein [Phenylobacterium sp.]